MRNHILDQYLDTLRLQLRHLPLAEQRQVLGDVRAHLEEDIAGRREEDKRLTIDEAALQATHAFGDPSDIGVAYGAGGGVVRKSTGEVLLHVAILTGRGVARGVGTTLKWVLITSLILIGVVAVIGIALLFVAGGVLTAYEDEIASSVPRPVYSYQQSWAVPDAQVTPHTDSFQVSTDATGFDFTIDMEPNTGCLAIQVLGPDGAVAYTNSQGCSGTHQHLHFSQQGSWRVQYAPAAFTGAVDVEAYEYRPANPG